MHRGRFYTQIASQDERSESPPKSTPFQEYEFIITVLDRVFLCLLGYTGMYEDWRGNTHE